MVLGLMWCGCEYGVRSRGVVSWGWRGSSWREKVNYWRGPGGGGFFNNVVYVQGVILI